MVPFSYFCLLRRLLFLQPNSWLPVQLHRLLHASSLCLLLGRMYWCSHCGRACQCVLPSTHLLQHQALTGTFNFGLIFHPAVRPTHALQVVSARVCALGALVGSPALFFMVWSARASVSTFLYLASPRTGVSYWGQVFHTSEWAVFMHMAGGILCLKVSGTSAWPCQCYNCLLLKHLWCME